MPFITSFSSNLCKLFQTALFVTLLFTPTSSFTNPITKLSKTKHTMTALNGAQLTQYAPAAASLFNNMKTPASILAGAMVPLGFSSPLPKSEEHPDTKFTNLLRRVYLVVTLLSFFSELLAVMWATVAVNYLTETVIAPAESVWHLLRRDVDLQWAAVNSHFVFGMFGFMWMIGTRALFLIQVNNVNRNMSIASVSTIIGSLTFLLSIVNRGVEVGGSDGGGYGKNCLSLFGHYGYLLCKQAISSSSFGVLETTAILCLIVAVVNSVLGIITELVEKEKQN